MTGPSIAELMSIRPELVLVGDLGVLLQGHSLVLLNWISDQTIYWLPSMFSRFFKKIASYDLSKYLHPKFVWLSHIYISRGVDHNEDLSMENVLTMLTMQVPDMKHKFTTFTSSAKHTDTLCKFFLCHFASYSIWKVQTRDLAKSCGIQFSYKLTTFFLFNQYENVYLNICSHVVT